MHISHAEHLAQVATGLGFYYLLLALMNWVAAAKMWREGPVTYFTVGPWQVTNMLTWLVVGGVFFILSPLAMMGWPPEFTSGAKHLINLASGAVTLTVGSTVALFVMFVFRKFFSHPTVAWTMLNLSLLAMGLSMADPNFYLIAAKPDNVPIVGLVFLLAFFTWLATRRAVLNDERRKQGLPPLEKLDDEKVLVWPDLVYTELICMIVLTAVLLFWGIALKAPLEEPASSVKTPNPSKAPWYFLGLQEMLVYYDPWYAGVVLPSIVIVGLMAIPYLDFNRGGNGYYTIDERKFAYLTFQVGFLLLWIVLIILGTFLRGPNWNFFGPFEYWDAHKVLAQNNVDLSQFFWNGLGMSLPKAPPGSGTGTELAYILLRESPGILLMAVYLIVLPPLMATTIFRSFFQKMGLIRFMIMAQLLLLMASLPLKMILRWTINLKYIISIPEYFLNF